MNIPTDPDQLAALYDLYRERAAKAHEESLQACRNLREIAFARAFALWGVKIGSKVSCPQAGEKCVVLDLLTFHNFEKKPTLSVDAGRGYPQPSSNEWELIPVNPVNKVPTVTQEPL